MPDIHLPTAWALVAPCGCIDGLTLSVSAGVIRCATPEAAWAKFTPSKRARDREAKQGFHIEPIENPLLANVSDCQHDPKWGIGKPSDSGSAS